MTPEEIQKAFLVAPREVVRRKCWWERTWWEKCLFWMDFTVIDHISEDIIALTLKNPNWLKDITK